MNIQNFLLFFMELIGTIAFAASGVMVGIRKNMDIFGVCVLGIVTAVGGGMVRDIVLCQTPSALLEPVYVEASVVTALVIFGFLYFRTNKNADRFHNSYDVILLIMDSIGLGIFTAVGVMTGIHQGYLVNSEKRISVDDWSAHGFNTDLTFIQIESVSDDDSEDSVRNILYAMTVRPDGSFDIEGRDITDGSFNEYLRLWNRNKDGAGGTIEGMVADGRGNINVIKHSNIITVPGEEAIQALKAGKTIRRNEHKYGSLRGLLDLKMLKLGDELFYYSGPASYSLQGTMNTAPNLRIVKAVTGELFFDDLIELMNVPFVRYKMLTVKPYPFKYLDEYRKRVYKSFF